MLRQPPTRGHRMAGFNVPVLERGPDRLVAVRVPDPSSDAAALWGKLGTQLLSSTKVEGTQHLPGRWCLRWSNTGRNCRKNTTTAAVWHSIKHTQPCLHNKATRQHTGSVSLQSTYASSLGGGPPWLPERRAYGRPSTRHEASPPKVQFADKLEILAMTIFFGFPSL